MIAKIVLVLGVLGLLLGFLVVVVSVALPALTDGRTSMEEAMLGIIPGVILVILSFLLAAVGTFFVIKGRKS